MTTRTISTILGAAALAISAAGCASDKSADAEERMQSDRMVRPASADAKAVNDYCPIAGGPVSDEQKVNYKGTTIGFCCANCLQAFMEMSEAERNEALARAKR